MATDYTTQVTTTADADKLDGLRKLSHILYALYAIHWFTGGITAIIAIVVPAAVLAVALRNDGESGTPGTSTPIGPPLDPTRAAVGAPAPDFTLPGIDGRIRSLGRLRGRPVVVNFFASWCRPCEDEMPVLERLARTGRVAVLDRKSTRLNSSH